MLRKIVSSFIVALGVASLAAGAFAGIAASTGGWSGQRTSTAQGSPQVASYGSESFGGALADEANKDTSTVMYCTQTPNQNGDTSSTPLCSLSAARHQGVGPFGASDYFTNASTTRATNFYGDFYACAIFSPTSTPSAAILTDAQSGGVPLDGGYRAEINAGVGKLTLYGPSGASATASTANSVVLNSSNLLCWGRGGTTGWVKLNNGAMVSFAGYAASAPAGGTALLGFEFPGYIYEVSGASQAALTETQADALWTTVSACRNAGRCLPTHAAEVLYLSGDDYKVGGSWTGSVGTSVTFTRSGQPLTRASRYNWGAPPITNLATYDSTLENAAWTKDTGVTVADESASCPIHGAKRMSLVSATTGVTGVSRNLALTTARSVHLARPTAGSDCSVITSDYDGDDLQTRSLTATPTRFSSYVPATHGIAVKKPADVENGLAYSNDPSQSPWIQSNITSIVDSATCPTDPTGAAMKLVTGTVGSAYVRQYYFGSTARSVYLAYPAGGSACDMKLMDYAGTVPTQFTITATPTRYTQYQAGTEGIHIDSGTGGSGCGSWCQSSAQVEVATTSGSYCGPTAEPKNIVNYWWGSENLCGDLGVSVNVGGDTSCAANVAADPYGNPNSADQFNIPSVSAGAYSFYWKRFDGYVEPNIVAACYFKAVSPASTTTYMRATTNFSDYYGSACSMTSSEWTRCATPAFAMNGGVWYVEIGLDRRDVMQSDFGPQSFLMWGCQLEKGVTSPGTYCVNSGGGDPVTCWYPAMTCSAAGGCDSWCQSGAQLEVATSVGEYVGPTTSTALTGSGGGLAWTQNGTVPRVTQSNVYPEGFGAKHGGLSGWAAGNNLSLGSGADSLDFAGDFTMCIKGTAPSDFSTYPMLFSDGHALISGYYLQWNNDGTFIFTTSTAGNNSATIPATVVAPSTQFVVCGGRDGSSQRAITNDGAVDSDGTTFKVVGSGYVAYVGRYPEAGYTLNDGVIHEVFATSSAATSAYITALRNAALSCTKPGRCFPTDANTVEHCYVSDGGSWTCPVHTDANAWTRNGTLTSTLARYSWPQGVTKADAEGAGPFSDSNYFSQATTSVLNFTGNFTCCTVFDGANWTANPVLLQSGAGGSAPGWFVEVVGSKLRLYGSTNTATGANTLTTGGPHLGCWGVDGSNLKVAVDGETPVSAAGTVTAATSGAAYLGRYSGGDSPFTGSINEVWCSSSAATDASMNRIARKWLDQQSSTGTAMTVTRTTDATALIDGKVYRSPAGTLRSTPQGKLYEGQVINYAQYSEQPVSGSSAQSPWVAGNAGSCAAMTLAADQSASPDGTITADRFTFPACPGADMNYTQIYVPFTATAAVWEYSFWAKKVSGTGTTIPVTFHDGNVTITGTTQCDLSSGVWTRCTGSATLTAATWLLLFGPCGAPAGCSAQGTAGIVVDVWGVQIEPGSFAHQYCGPTLAGSKTCNADAITVPNPLRPQGSDWTNLLIRSEEFDSGSWTKTGSAGRVPVVTANAALAADYSFTADKVAFPDVDPGAGQYSVITQGFTATAARYTYSVYGSTDSGTATLYPCIWNGATTYTAACTFTTTPSRCTFTPPSDLTAATWVAEIGVDSGCPGQAAQPAQNVYLWGAQVELGSTTSPFCPTTSAAATCGPGGATGKVNTNLMTYDSTLSNAAWTKTGVTVTDADATNCPLTPKGHRMSLVAGTGSSTSYPALVNWSKCADGSTTFGCDGTKTTEFPTGPADSITFTRAGTLECGGHTSAENIPCVPDADGAQWAAGTLATVPTHLTDASNWCMGFKAKSTWDGVKVFLELGTHVSANSAFIYTFGGTLYFQAYDGSGNLTFQQGTTAPASGSHTAVFCGLAGHGKTWIDGSPVHDVAFGAGSPTPGAVLTIGSESSGSNQMGGQMTKICQGDAYATVAACLAGTPYTPDAIVSRDLASTPARSVHLAYPTGGAACTVDWSSNSGANSATVTLAATPTRFANYTAGQTGIKVKGNTCTSWCQGDAQLENATTVGPYCGPTGAASKTCKPKQKWCVRAKDVTLENGQTWYGKNVLLAALGDGSSANTAKFYLTSGVVMWVTDATGDSRYSFVANALSAGSHTFIGCVNDGVPTSYVDGVEWQGLYGTGNGLLQSWPTTASMNAIALDGYIGSLDFCTEGTPTACGWLAAP